MNSLIMWILVGIVIMTVLFAPQDELEEELTRYCEMVELRQSSGDDSIGWPDYRGIYDDECKD